jgi:hypothetical protein
MSGRLASFRQALRTAENLRVSEQAGSAALTRPQRLGKQLASRTLSPGRRADESGFEFGDALVEETGLGECVVKRLVRERASWPIAQVRGRAVIWRTTGLRIWRSRGRW